MPRTAQKESADGKGTLEHNPGYTVAQIRPPEGAQEFPTTDEHGWTRIREQDAITDESGRYLTRRGDRALQRVTGAFRAVVDVDAKVGNSKAYPLRLEISAQCDSLQALNLFYVEPTWHPTMSRPKECFR